MAVYSQHLPDSTTALQEVVIRPYFSVQPLLRATGAVGLLSGQELSRTGSTSLVSEMNTIAGVRMEERSPGSYRLSLRGSLLRSPFGIRNVKIYLDEFPLTDAGGNTYLNALDMSAVGQIEILKGPQGSIYGANSGGVVLIQPRMPATDGHTLDFGLSGGSFGLFRENLVLGRKWKNYEVAVSQAYQRSDGYRDHSGMRRHYLQVNQQLNYARNAGLKVLLFYSDLQYETPGGLTAAQYALDPKLSRPGSGTLKSAVDQQAGIYSKTVYGGMMNNWQLSKHLKHVISVFSSYTDFKNPFITNYEHRKEFTAGLRTYLEYEQNLQTTNWKFNLGAESAGTATDDVNTDNNYGQPAALQASDKLKAATNFLFANLNIDLYKKLLLEISASENFYKYNYETRYPVAAGKQVRTFDPQFMPRIALSYLFSPDFSGRASVSKGYSPPTLAEIRASDNVINTDLQPEKGWNYEAGLRYRLPGQRLFVELTGFHYQLKNAIVSRLNENATEYFVNAGGTRQWGLESALSAWLIAKRNAGFVRGLLLTTNYTFSHFRFDHYFVRSADLSGKELTGVPKDVIVTGLELSMPRGLYVFARHNYTSRIPLTDANTVYAGKYHLLQAKVGCRELKIGKLPAELFAGADNLLNQKYSLGNDLNAAGGRYFNAAPARNFYAGINIRL